MIFRKFTFYIIVFFKKCRGGSVSSFLLNHCKQAALHDRREGGFPGSVGSRGSFGAVGKTVLYFQVFNMRGPPCEGSSQCSFEVFFEFRIAFSVDGVACDPRAKHKSQSLKDSS